LRPLLVSIACFCAGVSATSAVVHSASGTESQGRSLDAEQSVGGEQLETVAQSATQAARRRRRSDTTTTTAAPPSNRRRSRRRRKSRRRKSNRRRRRSDATTPGPTTPAPSDRRRTRRRRKETDDPATCDVVNDPGYYGSCSDAPCDAEKKCTACNTLNDIVKEYDSKPRAQFGDGFPDPWFLVATHQCHYFHHCKPAYDEYGDIDPDKMPGGPFKDPKYASVPYGHKCTGDPTKGWGNLGKCVAWKTCFESCLKQSNEAGKEKVDEQCNFVHFEADSGRCTAFTTKQCQDSDGKWSTTKTEGIVVMRAYFEDQSVRRAAAAAMAAAGAKL